MKTITPSMQLSILSSYLLVIGFCLVFQTSSKGQNYLMENEHSSFHSAAQISYSSFENHYSVLPGYTLDGRLTAEFGIGKTKDKINLINSTVIRPSLSYLAIKQKDEGFPISFELNAGYQFNYVTQVSFNAQTFLFGAGIHHQISPIDHVKITPSILLEGSKAISGPNQTFREKEVFALGLQTSIVWYEYYLSPKLTIQEGIYTIGVRLGMIFS